MTSVWLAVLLQSGAPAEALVREVIAETALAQLSRIDARWHPEQRDCAGLVRFSYRSAFDRLAPARARAGLWRDRLGERTAFADAETLLAAQSFLPLGRDASAAAQLDSGDVVAFRVSDEEPATYHLMLVVRRGQDGPWVVYHSGRTGESVRGGPLAKLASDAPREWQPHESNPAFLGFYRYREWTR